jgi:hypothetical protein
MADTRPLPRTWTANDDLVFHGFDRRMKDAEFIALVKSDGETDIWALDANAKPIIEQLSMYYLTVHDEDVKDSDITVYQRVV